KYLKVKNMGLFSVLFGNSSSPQLTEVIKKGAFLVDVRTPAEFLAGSVKGAVNVPLDSVSNKLSKFKGKKHTVVLCGSGNRSGQAKSILEQNCFQDLINGGSVSNIHNIINDLQ